MIFCEACAVSDHVAALYRELDHLAHALVVMEDLDLTIGQRAGSTSRGLNDFLLALDGAMTTHEGVVTLATTNDPSAIDAAARRPGRFDAVVPIDPPNASGRAAILRRYLRALDADVDCSRVAAETDGWTGADLRELVTCALLCASAAVVRTALLLQLVRESGRARGPGQYLWGCCPRLPLG